MKSKLFSLFVALSLLASLLGAGSVLAQAPIPPVPSPAPRPPMPSGADPRSGYLAPAGAPAADLGALVIPPGLPGLSFRYLKSFGQSRVPYLVDNGHLNYPWGIGTIGNNVWVGELWGQRALKYSSTGAFVRGLGTAGDPDVLDTVLMEIADVAADAGGNVWVADQASSHVAKFNSSGNLVRELGVVWQGGSDNSHFARSVGVALDSGGNVYVSDGTPWYDGSGDTGNQRVQVFNSAGNYLATIGVTGEAGADNDHLHGPKHLAVYGAQLYVADAGNQRVQIFNISNPAAPAYVATIGETGVRGSNSSHFNHPSGVAVDTDYIYVADTYNNRVQVFTRATRIYVKTIGGTWGAANNQFKNPTDVAVDASHRVYVADFVNLRVQQFSHSGAIFTYARTYGVTGVPYLTDGSHYNRPSGVAVARDGSIYITEELGHRVVKLNASGVPQWSVGEPGVKGDWSSANNRLNNPLSVAVGAAGRVYVADLFHGRVQIYSAASGSFITKIDGLGCPGAVYSAPTGDLYVTDACNSTVLIYSSSLTLQHTIGVPGVPGSDNAHFNWPIGVAVDSSGTIYVSDSGNHRVQVFDSSRAYLRTLGTTGECDGDFAHVCNPNDLFVDSADRLYLADAADRIQVFDSSGAYLTTIAGNWSRENSGLRAPSGVAVDRAGNVYVADTNNNRIQKFAAGYPGWSQANINGFGDRWLAGTARLGTFGGHLYAGGALDGVQVWRTSDGTMWSPMVTDSFGDPTNTGITDFAEFKGNLYASTWSCSGSGQDCGTSNGGQVWRTDGTTWSNVISGGFGNADNFAIGTLAVFSNQIYAATTQLATGVLKIYRSSTGDLGDWGDPVVSNGFGGTGIHDDVIMDVYGGYLYVGLSRNDIAELWRTNDGTTWPPVFTNGLAAHNSMLSSMAVFNGAFYIGLNNDATGGEVWKSTNGTTFSRVFAGGLGNKNNILPFGLYASGGSLYAIFTNLVNGAEVWRSPDGSNWQKISSGGWGDANNYLVDAADKGAEEFGGRLYIGTFNWGNGGEIWSTVLPQTDSYMSAASQDGWILESGETTNVGGTMNATTATFNLGDDALNRQYRAILSFNTGALPDNAVIQSVVLKIKRSGVPVGINPFNVLGGLLVDIRKPYFGTAGGLQRVDFNAAASAAKVGTFGKTPSAGWYSVTLNAAGRAKINKAGLTQFRLYFTLDDNNNLLANYAKFFSGNAALGSRPILYITYTVP